MNAVLKTLRWPADERDRKRNALWTAAEIAEATGGTASGAFQAAGVEMDSRDVRSRRGWKRRSIGRMSWLTIPQGPLSFSRKRRETALRRK